MTTKTEVKFARQSVYAVLEVIMLIAESSHTIGSTEERLQEIEDLCSKLMKEIDEANTDND